MRRQKNRERHATSGQWHAHDRSPPRKSAACGSFLLCLPHAGSAAKVRRYACRRGAEGAAAFWNVTRLMGLRAKNTSLAVFSTKPRRLRENGKDLAMRSTVKNGAPACYASPQARNTKAGTAVVSPDIAWRKADRRQAQPTFDAHPMHILAGR